MRLGWGLSHPRNRQIRVTQQGCQTTVHSPNVRPPSPRFRMLRPNSRPRDGPPRSTERGSHDSFVTWNRPGWRPQPHASPKLRPVRPRFRIRRWHLSSSGVGCRGGPPSGADGRPLERMWSSPGPKRGWIRHWASGAAAARRRDELRRWPSLAGNTDPRTGDSWQGCPADQGADAFPAEFSSMTCRAVCSRIRAASCWPVRKLMPLHPSFLPAVDPPR